MKSSKTVLIVDDDSDWINIIKSLLEKAGYACLSSTNFDDALTLLTNNQPLALVLDLQLDNNGFKDDEWEGWQLADVAKEQYISSIIVSGYPRDDRYYRAYRDFNIVGFFDKGRFADQKAEFLQCIQDAVHETKKQKKNREKKNIFISYSHKDNKWLEMFSTHLKVLSRNNPITIWDDTKIRSGAKWKDEINKALTKAKAAILLVTPDFLASDFIANNELPPLLEAAENQGLIIFWVAVKSSLYDETPISDYQGANNPSKPLASLSDADVDKEIVEICKKIKEELGL